MASLTAAQRQQSELSFIRLTGVISNFEPTAAKAVANYLSIDDNTATPPQGS